MKQELRQQARKLVANINHDWHTEVSASVCSRLYNYLSSFSYLTIGLYLPMPDEIDVRPLINRLCNEGKIVSLPRILSSTEIGFFNYTPSDSIEWHSAFPLQEPTITATRIEGTLDVLIVPALHYYQGYRLGRGKGYYDRYLQEHHPSKLLVGVSLGLLGEAPFTPDPWDVPMQIVFTP